MPAPEKNKALRYIPELDGLRAFAVLVVIAFHTMPKLIQNGGVGVDLFFVLSGYLITRILLSEYESTGRIRFGNFYMRRFLRLTPALWLMLLAFGFDGIRLGGELMHEHLEAALYAALYVTNWIRAFELTEGSSLNHTWSLAVEEQFYLVIPTLLIVALPRIRLGRAWALFTVLAVLSAGWRAYLALTGSDTARIYNGSDTRAETLLIGCVVASVPLDRLAPWASKLWPVALIFLVGAIILIHPTLSTELPNVWNVTVGFTAIGLAAGCLLVALVHHASASRVPILSWPPVVYLGRISYGLYLWHFPIYIIVERRDPAPLHIFVLTLLATITVASLSWYLLERPVLRLKKRFEPAEGKALAAA